MCDTVDTVDHKTELGNTKNSVSRCRGFVVVINNWTEEEYNLILEYAQKHCEKYVVAKEHAPSTGTPHLQCWLYHKHPQRFDRMKELFPRAKLIRSKGNANQQLVYCSKEDPNPVHKGCEKPLSMQEQIKKKIFERDYTNVIWKPWQKKVLDHLDEEDSRKILWIYDKEGNNGKSFLRKYISLTKDVLLFDGKKDNILNQLKQKCIDEDKDVKYVVADIPRCYDLRLFQYGLLEQLKDGQVYSGKYEGGEIWIDRPNIVILSNSYPDTSTMTNDRWEIVDLSVEDIVGENGLSSQANL